MATKARRRVVFLAPSLYTTQGHASISKAVRSALGSVEHFDVMPIYSMNLVMMQAIKTWAPHLLIVDFPFTSAMPGLTDLKLAPELNSCIFVELAMHAGEEAVAPPNLFDLSVELEPGACASSPADRVVRTGLLLNNHHLEEPRPEEVMAWDEITTRGYRGKASKPLLVMQTGGPEEQTWLISAARHWAAKQNTDYIVVPSLALPQPAARFMPYAAHLFCATGYSTVWEVYAHDRVKDTTFVNLDRPLENLGARLIALRDANSLNAVEKSDLLRGHDRLAEELPRWSLA